MADEKYPEIMKGMKLRLNPRNMSIFQTVDSGHFSQVETVGRTVHD